MFSKPDPKLAPINANELYQHVLHYYSGHYKEENHLDACERVSLMCGLSGITLLQFLLFENERSKPLKREIHENIESIIALLETQKPLSYTFCDGIAGVGWLFAHLSEAKFISFGNDFLEEIDTTLAFSLNGLLNDKNYDFLHGAIGVGIYFMKRRNFAEVGKIIISLFEEAEDQEPEAKFINAYFNDQRLYDFGMAHGNTAILYFLGKSYALGIEREKCYALIQKLKSFFFNNIQDYNAFGVYFPYKISVSDYNAGRQTPTFCRLGWCYGDIAVLNTFLLIADWINDRALKKLILNMLHKTILRKSKEETLIEDACFCHGSSGLGYMCHNLHKLTGDDLFLQASEYWLGDTLLRYQETMIAGNSSGYAFNLENAGLAPSSDLLNGYGGVGLFIVSLLHKKNEGTWNEIFLLS